MHGHLDTALLKSKAVNDSGKLSYEDARDVAIKSHKKTFPFSNCSKKCLKAQLDKHYKGKCDKDLTYVKMPGGVDAGQTQRQSGI